MPAALRQRPASPPPAIPQELLAIVEALAEAQARADYARRNPQPERPA